MVFKKRENYAEPLAPKAEVEKEVKKVKKVKLNQSKDTSGNDKVLNVRSTPIK